MLRFIYTTYNKRVDNPTSTEKGLQNRVCGRTKTKSADSCRDHIEKRCSLSSRGRREPFNVLCGTFPSFSELLCLEPGTCGVDYQMIQTKRGKDMLLYDGYTFTQNRMCKDGMRWQCSFPKCKAFCRMSSAGWLTPHKTNHEHARPSEEEIKKRILRMELKARAQSSGATPGEIIRNALPAEEYQTTDQRACYTRCIQRFRKSLQRKNSKQQDESWAASGTAMPNEDGTVKGDDASKEAEEEEAEGEEEVEEEEERLWPDQGHAERNEKSDQLHTYSM